MLGAKTILLAATVALALGQSDAAAESRLRVRIHGKGTTCASGQSPMSVEGVEGVFCVSGQSCVADIDGSCPGEQTGLPYGSYCGIVKTGVHGCMPYTEPQGDSADSAECGDGESPMSVEGVEGIFCVTGQACVADINGTCPGVQDGLPYGSSCGIVKTGVHGCKPNSRHHHHHKSHHKGTTCASGQSPMSVEGVEGVFCVSGQSCVADIDGSCPGEQTGLPYGSYCGIVKTGVHGCMPYTEPQGDSADSAECGDGESPMSVEGVEGIFCVSGQACVADIDGACPGVQDGLPYGSSCGIVKTGVHGCKPNSRHHHHKKHHHKGTTCASGQSPMSVEGVEGIFCVSGQSCVADIDGSCPGEQTGLPYGSYCGIVKTGVHGCMPYTEPQSDSDDSDDSCADGESPMSVEGVEGIFCVTGQACVADINGTCPGVQDGLPYGSSCGIVKTGVHGCKPNNALHHRKHKSHHDQH